MKLVRPKRRDILKSDMQVLCCPVNTMAVMGNGLAKHFRNNFPGLYAVFQRRCNQGLITVNGLTASNLLCVGDDKYVLFFPSKNYWLDASSIEYIKNALRTLPQVMADAKLTSIAIPPVGCGHGGLHWDKRTLAPDEKAELVEDVIMEMLHGSDLIVELHPPK